MLIPIQVLTTAKFALPNGLCEFGKRNLGRSWAVTTNVSLVGLFLIPIKGMKYLVFVSGGLPLWTGWRQNVVRRNIQLPVAVRGGGGLCLSSLLHDTFWLFHHKQVISGDPCFLPYKEIGCYVKCRGTTAFKSFRQKPGQRIQQRSPVTEAES